MSCAAAVDFQSDSDFDIGMERRAVTEYEKCTYISNGKCVREYLEPLSRQNMLQSQLAAIYLSLKAFEGQLNHILQPKETSLGVISAPNVVRLFNISIAIGEIEDILNGMPLPQSKYMLAASAHYGRSILMDKVQRSGHNMLKLYVNTLIERTNLIIGLM